MSMVLGSEGQLLPDESDKYFLAFRTRQADYRTRPIIIKNKYFSRFLACICKDIAYTLIGPKIRSNNLECENQKNSPIMRATCCNPMSANPEYYGTCQNDKVR